MNAMPTSFEVIATKPHEDGLVLYERGAELFCAKKSCRKFSLKREEG